MHNPLVFCFPFLLPVPTALASSTEQREQTRLPRCPTLGHLDWFLLCCKYTVTHVSESTFSLHSANFY